MRFHGDMRQIVPKLQELVSLVIADPPYSTFPLINEAIDVCLPKCTGTSLFFMYPIDLCSLVSKPNQILFWVKPESTKNTSRKYSSFVEIIAAYSVRMNSDLHWSNRTGVFTDRILHAAHPFRKPESLIERLILNHYPGSGNVLDPFAGSQTVEIVCARLGIPCISVDIDE